MTDVEHPEMPNNPKVTLLMMCPSLASEGNSVQQSEDHFHIVFFPEFSTVVLQRHHMEVLSMPGVVEKGSNLTPFLFRVHITSDRCLLIFKRSVSGLQHQSVKAQLGPSRAERLLAQRA